MKLTNELFIQIKSEIQIILDKTIVSLFMYIMVEIRVDLTF